MIVFFMPFIVYKIERDKNHYLFYNFVAILSMAMLVLTLNRTGMLFGAPMFAFLWIRAILKNEDREKIILFAATLYKEKGYLDLIDAFAKVCEKYPDWHLKIAGNGSQDEGLARVTKWGIQDNVEFLGWVKGEEKDRVFRSASIFCLPSYAEGFPMAVLDAWAYGIPVVTTPVGGIPDIVVNNENGLLFNPGDAETLSVQLCRLIEDDNLYQKLKKEASNLAATTFNIETFAGQISDMYNDLTR
jgi:glycosyltransferase involved in cell wall biosynthesis